MLETENLLDSLLPMINMSILFGVAPRLPSWGRTLKFLSTAFPLMAMTTAATIEILHIIQPECPTENNKVLKYVSWKVAHYFFVVATLACAATHLTRRSNIRFMKIIETLARIDEDLKLDKVFFYTTTKRFLFAIFVGLSILHLGLFGWIAYSMAWNFPGLVFFVMLHLILMQYIVLAALLKQRFALINKNLMNAFGVNENADEDLSVLDLAEMSRASRIRWMKVTKRKMKNEGRLVEILNSLQETHTTLTDLIDDANSLYALPNAMILLACVAASTDMIYYFVAIVFGKLESWDNGFLFLQSILLIIIMTMVFLYSVVCGDTLVVARRPVVLVETLKLHLGPDQQKLIERLDLFSRHVKVTRFRFTAYSVVTFDYSLLGTFATTVTIYLIILVQLSQSRIKDH